jgi:hypothetical protein
MGKSKEHPRYFVESFRTKGSENALINIAQQRTRLGRSTLLRRAVTLVLDSPELLERVVRMQE